MKRCGVLPFQLILLILVLIALMQSPGAQAKKTIKSKNDSYAQEISKAEDLFFNGQRFEAVSLLNNMIMSTKNANSIARAIEKRQLILEQYVSSESFQKLQESKFFLDEQKYIECLQELSKISSVDQSNLSVLRAQTECQKGAGQYGAALKSAEKILQLLPKDLTSKFLIVEIELLQKNVQSAQKNLSDIQANFLEKVPEQLEQLVILKSKALVQLGQVKEAIDMLRIDQEVNLDHMRVLYELGTLYSQDSASNWYARKYISLFITRCKRLSPAVMRARKLDGLLPIAQSLLKEVEKKLEI